MFNPLKVRDWLKFRNQDYNGFLKHIEAWQKQGIHFGDYDIQRIAKSYNLPEPTIRNREINFKIKSQSINTQFDIPININSTKYHGS
jgi:hypothetical protein